MMFEACFQCLLRAACFFLIRKAIEIRIVKEGKKCESKKFFCSLANIDDDIE